jgi:hypothetical protein
MVKIAIKSKADENILALIEKEMSIKNSKCHLLFQAATIITVRIEMLTEWLNEAEK